jgi:putative ABC transport system substrate-binding protein
MRAAIATKTANSSKVARMNRRRFIAGSMSAGVLAGSPIEWARAATAQPDAPVIGLLDGACGFRLLAEVSRGLEEEGLFQVRHYRFEYSRWIGAEFQVGQLAKHAAELVRRQVALIFAFSSKAALAAKTVTDTTPIIFLADDPTASGLVSNPERPGGNLTGVACRVSGLTGKRIEIARDLVPAATRVTLVTDPTNAPAHEVEIGEAHATAGMLGLALSIVEWTGQRSIDADIEALAQDGKTLLVFGTGVPFLVRYPILSFLAARDGIPAIHAYRTAVEDGGLASLGTRRTDGAYQMGRHAARILKGDKPADLPVRQIIRSELVINLATARSLGLRIASALLACADEVIE